MRCVLRVAAAIAALVVASGLAMAEPVNEKRDIPQDAVCVGAPGNRTLSPKFLDWLLDNHEITRDCERSATKHILLQAVPDRERCAKQVNNINLAKSLAASVLLGGSKDEHFRGSVGDGDTSLLTERKLIEGFIDGSIKVTCVGKKATPPRLAFQPSGLDLGGWTVRLRQDQTSLEYEKKDGDKYKKAKSAKLGFTDNGVKNESKLEVNATVGLASPKRPCGFGARCQVIPYIKLDQGISAPAKGSDKDTTIYGALGFVDWAPFPWLNTITSYDAQYIVDHGPKGDAEAMGYTLRWRPAITVGDATYPGKYLPLFNESILFGYEYGMVVRHGHTLEAGGNQIFAGQKDFLYYGPEIDVAFLGMRGTILEKMRLLLHYNILYRESGSFRQLPYFSADLSYALDKDGDIDISLTYQRGREYETFEERDLLKASLGYKF